MSSHLGSCSRCGLRRVIKPRRALCNACIRRDDTQPPDFTDATCSAAVGGVTTLLDHPLTPPVVTDETRFADKVALGERTAVIDFGLHGGVDPTSVGSLPDLWAAGATGIKLFTCPTGGDLGWFGDPASLRDVFERLAAISPPDVAKHYRGVLSSDPAVRRAADDWLYANEPRHSSMLRTSVSPNVISGGYRSNVIPSEARATLDVRMLPDEDPERFLAEMKKVVNDTAVEVRFQGASFGRPTGIESKLNSDAFKAIEGAVRRVYKVPTIPVMSTGATDMSFTRAKGIQCFGIGPAVDMEDGPRGFGAHSDQERILESELHRFVRLNWDVVSSLARASSVTVP